MESTCNRLTGGDVVIFMHVVMKKEIDHTLQGAGES